LPEKFAPHTELLDLKPILLSDLKNPAYEKLYTFKHFNPIQTQAFNTLYNHDNSCLIAAPTGSGKTVCAELAVLRLFNSNPTGRCVYVAPMPALVKERMRDWSVKFGQKLDKTVVELTGETSHDLKLLEKGNVIISTPENWDLISRRWKQRKNVQNIALFIVDELHLIGGENGPTLEVIVSRMRHIASQTDNKIRIVGLSASVANAKDLADWIGATSNNTFNFHPNTRPIPLEIHIQGFDIIHFGSRLLAMSRPMMYAVSHHGKGKPVIIFVPNRKQVRSTTRDLINYVDPEDPNRRFLHISEADLEPILDQIQNKALKESLKYGIAVHHENISEKEKRIVEKLFTMGAVQVLIVTYSLCWEINFNSYTTIIMGTQYYDGK
jgi:pre-mRNA-splicing helicase BRR2